MSEAVDLLAAKISMCCSVTDAQAGEVARFLAVRYLSLTGKGEPVAWRRRGKNLRWEYRDDGSSSVAVSGWAPLYTRPVAWPDREAVENFQGRVGVWTLECFGPVIPFDKVERNDRFIEEALELTQATGYSRERAHALVDYVFDRPIGEPSQEVGGVMVTLAALCNVHGLDLTADGLRELERIEQPAIMAKIKAKQAAKPTGSTLPSASDCAGTEGGVR